MKLTKLIIWSALFLPVLPLKTYALCYCSEPTEPSIPSGYYADSYEMESARSEVESYISEIQEYRQCLARCIDDANSNAENVIYEWNSAVRQYNNR